MPSRPRLGSRAIAALALVAAGARVSSARAPQDSPPATTASAPEVLVPHEWLVLPRVDAPRRAPIQVSTFFARSLLHSDALPTHAGDKVNGELGQEQEFARREADANGRVASGPMAGALCEIEMPEERVLLAELGGASALYVNGFPQIGDLYGDGASGLPVLLRKGHNLLVVPGGRGDHFRLRLVAPGAPLLVNPFDATCGDLRLGELEDAGAGADPRAHGNAAVLLVNASEQTLDEVTLETGDESGPFRPWRHELDVPLPPRAILKTPIVLRPDAADPELSKAGRVKALVRAKAGSLVASSTLDVSVVAPTSLHRRTYVSYVDGSIQEYAVLPPSDSGSSVVRPRGLVLTLHGAGVDCANQAAAYSQKPDFWIVAPTNRRPYGFDWQDWGRRDAYDVLEEALAFSGVDRDHVYLTGHSMGGHGTWHLAVNDPATFAAIAPSAGWASFSTYVVRNRKSSEWSALWRGADGASDTLALLDNLRSTPIFILHGEADDNVPVGEAKTLLAALQERGAKPQFHFEEKAGHWWDGPAAAGVDCVDWPGIFELFRGSTRATPLALDFTTADPGVQSDDRWLRVVQPIEYGKRVHVTATWDAAERRATITTENARLLEVRAPDGNAPKECCIDGVTFAAGRLFVREGTSWREGSLEAWLSEKTPDRCGPFKRAFDRDFVLVYGTQGDTAQNRELYERARYDASSWWYRANGRAPLLRDDDFLERCEQRGAAGRRWRECDVILYGNRDTNAAWDAVLGEEWPIRCRNGEVRVGARRFKGTELAALFVAPRAPFESEDPTRRDRDADDPPVALVGVFGDSGRVGARLGYTLSPFVSGVGYPDYLVFGSDALRKGDDGVLAAGWFDAKWRLPGEE